MIIEEMRRACAAPSLVSGQKVQAANSTGDEDNGTPAPGVTTGDWVWLKAPGHPRWDEPIWTGPFKITEVSDRGAKGSKRREIRPSIILHTVQKARPPEWSLEQVRTNLLSFQDINKEDGDGESKEGDRNVTGSDEWVCPPEPYTPNCPIGNPYCKHGQGGGAGWACWKWAEKYCSDLPNLRKQLLTDPEFQAYCREILRLSEEECE
ncbi:hypothetical protein GJAV_G00207700 [Gymnothorax javanicus]|nr:hypothetical protein GJAV_G00207700 [Gymnothorax javanicus]